MPEFIDYTANANPEDKSKTGLPVTTRISVCYKCDPQTYPRGKPVINDEFARREKDGSITCSDCIMEEINKMKLRILGPNHPEVKAFIEAEDKALRRYNDAARRTNAKSNQFLIPYKRNRYTGNLPLTPEDVKGCPPNQTFGGNKGKSRFS
jgi:hypothetical protein